MNALATAPDWLVARPIAHRGLHDAGAGLFENTLSAALAAVEAGFAIECDVQASADGEALVFHDHTLGRLTREAGPVHGLSAAALQALAVGGTADRIPTLAGFLDAIAGRVPLIVEIKSRFDRDLGLTRRTLEIIAGQAGPVAVKSFDPEVVAEVRRLAPGLPRGIVAEASFTHPSWAALSAPLKHHLGNLLHWPETQPHFISWHVADLPHAAPFLARQLGRIPVMAWTVRDPEARARAAAHADQMVFESFRP